MTPGPAEPGGGMEQLGFEGMPARLYAATPTRLATWRDCPRRYRLTYLDRPAPPRGGASARASIGTSVHQALADWWGLAQADRTPDAAHRLLLARWRPEGFRDDAQSARWRRRVAEETRAYARTQDPESHPLGVERTVAVTTPAAVLSGRVDRLDDRDGELVVVDYKTSRGGIEPHEAGASTALALYAVAVAATVRRPCTAVELHHVPTATVVRHDHTPGSLRRHVAAAERVCAELGSADAAHAAGDREDAFPPLPAPRCSGCEVRQHCPQGQAFPARPGWWGLDEAEPPTAGGARP